MTASIPMALEAGFDPRSDVFNRLLKNRVVMLGSDVNDDIANQICAQLLYLEGEDPNLDIWLYVNSPGGSVTAGMAIYDTIQFLRAPVNTICMGMAASMGSFLMAAGRPGKRSALPHSRIMIHQPWGGAQGTAADIEIAAAEIQRLKDSLHKILAQHTGKPVEQVAKDSDRDYFMSANEAMAYGLVDKVIDPTKG